MIYYGDERSFCLAVCSEIRERGLKINRQRFFGCELLSVGGNAAAPAITLNAALIELCHVIVRSWRLPYVWNPEKFATTPKEPKYVPPSGGKFVKDDGTKGHSINYMFNDEVDDGYPKGGIAEEILRQMKNRNPFADFTDWQKQRKSDAGFSFHKSYFPYDPL